MSPRYEYRVIDRRGDDTRPQIIGDGGAFRDRREARQWKAQLQRSLPAFGPYVIQRRSLEWEDVS